MRLAVSGRHIKDESYLSHAPFVGIASRLNVTQPHLMHPFSKQSRCTLLIYSSKNITCALNIVPHCLVRRSDGGLLCIYTNLKDGCIFDWTRNNPRALSSHTKNINKSKTKSAVQQRGVKKYWWGGKAGAKWGLAPLPWPRAKKVNL